MCDVERNGLTLPDPLKSLRIKVGFVSLRRFLSCVLCVVVVTYEFGYPFGIICLFL